MIERLNDAKLFELNAEENDKNDGVYNADVSAVVKATDEVDNDDGNKQDGKMVALKQFLTGMMQIEMGAMKAWTMKLRQTKILKKPMVTVMLFYSPRYQEKYHPR